MNFKSENPFFMVLVKNVSQWLGGMNACSILAEVPQLFNSTLGTVDCATYEIELTDLIPVRSYLYRCAAPKLSVFRSMVDELLDQGLMRPSKSPYASPAFLGPKNGGVFRLFVDYRIVNSKMLFDSYSCRR